MATTVDLRVTTISDSLGQGTSVGHLSQERRNCSKQTRVKCRSRGALSLPAQHTASY